MQLRDLSDCWTKQEVDVEDIVFTCTTEVEEKCEDKTSGFTTNTSASNSLEKCAL